MKLGFTSSAAVALALVACSSASPEGNEDSATAGESGSGSTPAASFTDVGTSDVSGPTTTGPTGMSNSNSGEDTSDIDTSDISATEASSTTITSETSPTFTGTESDATSLSGSSSSLSETNSASDTESASDTDSTDSTADSTGADTSTTNEGDDTTSTGDDTSTGNPPDECEPVLHATIRDFAFAHPDFENYGGNAAYKGLVQVDLGPDQKPVYAHPGPTPQTTGPNEFKQWYNDTPGVNQTFAVDLPLVEVMPGIFQFADNTFFPIDNLGFGNEGQPNNFAFTTEIHTTFLYNGGETFTFTGDDDVWIFINKKLAIDLGGLHPQLSDSINLDAAAAMLGITPGNVYAMDIFHAERHTNESNFRIDTTIGCFMPQ